MPERCMCGAEDCIRCHPSTRSRKLAQAMSSEEYAECGYNQCPVCKSMELDAGVPDCDGKHVTQRVSCECGAEWTDLYVLEGYIDLEVSH
jgi:hypothetical protein